ncbi:MAG: GIY-YIG nuclease family protein [Aliidongia sp.]
MSARNAALKEAARQRKIPMGIYSIRNLATGLSYVGSSVNVPAALNRHRFTLQLGSHLDAALMADGRRDGADSFVFEVLDLLPETDEPPAEPASELAALLELWTAQLGDRVAGVLA